jgi:N-acetyl-anhydromuramyl-L-alanine amidase AmpD
MHRSFRGVALAAALFIGIGSCALTPAEHARIIAQQTSSLGAAIDAASERFGVPRAVLMAVSFAETGWRGPSEQDPHAGEPGSLHAPSEIGPMNLRHGAGYDSLARAMALLQVSEQELRASVGLQVAGAAAVLAELGAQTGADPANVDSWVRAVARYSGLIGQSAQADYVEHVWTAIRRGLRDRTFTGETLELLPTAGPTARELLGVAQTAQFSTDYGPARWVPASSSNYSTGRNGPIQYIVIHTMQGSYAGSISWFQNPAARASAHYNIRSSDGEITQMVRESDTAWHAGNSYYNNRSIGIEHEGYVSDPGRWYTTAMYVASARLTRALCDKYRIPIDREHIIGHYQVPVSGSGPPCSVTATNCGGAGRHTDPGNGGTQWDWDRFLNLVRNNGMEGPAVPAYDATLVGMSYPMTAVSGTRPVAWIEYRNTGSRAWDTTNTRIGTTNPRDHRSPFFDMVNWINDHRPTAVDRMTPPGAVGRFSFVLNIPTVSAPTTITETFGLVQEGTTWFGPPDDAVSFSIRVIPPGSSTSDAGAPAHDAGTMDAGSVLPISDSGVTEPDATAATDSSMDAPLPSDRATPPRDSGIARDGRPGVEQSGCSCSTIASPSPIDPRALLLAAMGLVSLARRRNSAR